MTDPEKIEPKKEEKKQEEKPVETPPVEKPTEPVSSPAEPKQPEEAKEEVTISKADYDALLKAQEVGETYKKENEKYRTKRVETLTQPTAKVEEQVETELAYDEQKTIENAYLKDKADILNSPEITEFAKNCSDEQYAKLENLIGASDSLYQEALKNKTFVAKPKLEKQIKDIIDFVKGPDIQKVEQARAEGAVEAAKMEGADIGTMSSPKGVESGVTEEAKQYSEKSGGTISPKRAQEMADAKAERAKEYEPQIEINQVG